MATKVPAKGRAGIYVRISRNHATEVSSEVQEQECRALCAEREWHVVDVYTDAGRSAFKRDTSRPALDRLLDDVEGGLVNRVVAFKVDRLARNVADFIGFVDRVESVGATVTLSSQDFDTSTASGRLLRTILASFAEFESELKRERIGGSMAHKAARGKAHPGGTRLYGYSASRDEIVVKEARELQAAARSLLAGRSLAEIARGMNDRGITTTTGKAWRPWVLGRTLRNPFLAGLRSYRGTTVAGDWPPIFDVEKHEAVVVVLSDPGRTTTSSTAPRHLLAGIVYCARCEARMVSRPLRPGQLRYVCPEPERGGCGRTTVNLKLADERVYEEVIDRLVENADEIAAALGTIDVAALEREEAEIVRRQAELAGEWARDALEPHEWSAARQVLAERAEHVERERRLVDRRAPSLPRDRDGLERLWVEATSEEKRTMVRLAVDRVEIGPGARGKWNPDRVTVI